MTSSSVTNARVFDGSTVGAPTTVVITDGLIEHVGGDVKGEVFDGRGGTLLPGLIDAHVHVETMADLEQLVAHGVTTAFDLASPHPEVVDGLRHHAGLPQVLSAGIPATALGGAHTKKMGFPQSSIVTGPDDAMRFVDERIAAGSDYIKIIVEDPRMPGTAALPLDTIAALVIAAHAKGLLTIAHAVTSTAIGLASDAGVDVITHAPLNRGLTSAEAEALAKRGAALIPTLAMLQGTAGVVTAGRVFRLLRRLNIAPPVEFANARSTVATAAAAGLVVLAGTDANNEPGAPWHPAYGSSLHDELDLLVDAGLSPLDALNAATRAPAAVFGLADRGSIAPGQRADLVLVDGDPTVDIRRIRSISAVWVDGVKIG